ncbi:MAG: methionyl-tRNA formyltransferase [Thermoleophilia bacterium]|nr:methionyl-tRNA formyltransferase [Thermoleophilia bacterium]
MKIALIGQAAFGEKVFEALLAEGEEVVVVYMPPDPAPGKSNTFRELAEANGIPVRQPARMRDPEVFEEYGSFDADLNVMAFVTDIVPATILDNPVLGTIQYHPSLLPRHRGASAINWAVINGEPKTGLSIFWPDEGLDTGPILLQKEVTIEPDDTLGTVYFGKLFPLGVEALVESVRLVKEGKAPKIVQDLSQGEYEPVCKKMVIDWMYPVGVVYNVIRGCNPSPGAATTFQGQQVKIFDCERRAVSGPEAPGTVLEIAADGFLVAASGGSILVKRLQPAGAVKVAATEFASSTGLKVGDRLGS